MPTYPQEILESQENAVAVSMINTAQTVAAAASAASSTSAASRTASAAANRKSSTASASSAVSAFPPSPAGSSSSGAFVMRGPSSGLVIPTPEVFTAGSVHYEDLYRCGYKFMPMAMLEGRHLTLASSSTGDGR